LGGEQVTGGRNEPPPQRYRIGVWGRLGETIRSAFLTLQARARPMALHVLAEIEALGLELLEVRRLPPP
jgi:hypothetical protein